MQVVCNLFAAGYRLVGGGCWLWLFNVMYVYSVCLYFVHLEGLTPHANLVYIDEYNESSVIAIIHRIFFGHMEGANNDIENDFVEREWPTRHRTEEFHA